MSVNSEKLSAGYLSVRRFFIVYLQVIGPEISEIILFSIHKILTIYPPNMSYLELVPEKKCFCHSNQFQTEQKSSSHNLDLGIFDKNIFKSSIILGTLKV